MKKIELGFGYLDDKDSGKVMKFIYLFLFILFSTLIILSIKNGWYLEPI